MATTTRMKMLFAKARQGTLTPVEDAELSEMERLDDAHSSAPAKAHTIYDLPMAAKMWRADARRIER